jgi:hypothetical protein
MWVMLGEMFPIRSAAQAWHFDPLRHEDGARDVRPGTRGHGGNPARRNLWSVAALIVCHW